MTQRKKMLSFRLSNETQQMLVEIQRDLSKRYGLPIYKTECLQVSIKLLYNMLDKVQGLHSTDFYTVAEAKEVRDILIEDGGLLID